LSRRCPIALICAVTGVPGDDPACYGWEMILLFVFFFQAEDGIRDDLVTGVQTCALPIWCRPSLLRSFGARVDTARDRVRVRSGRSEERRVGKECGSRWAPGLQRKKLRVGIGRGSGGMAN